MNNKQCSLLVASICLQKNKGRLIKYELSKKPCCPGLYMCIFGLAADFNITKRLQTASCEKCSLRQVEEIDG